MTKPGTKSAHLNQNNIEKLLPSVLKNEIPDHS